MKNLNRLLFVCLIMLTGVSTKAQGFKKSSTGWGCEGNNPFTNTTFYYDGVTPTTGILSLAQNPGAGFNITSATNCSGYTFYCATQNYELIRAVVTNINSSTFSATTPHWIKGTVVLPNSKVYITVAGGSAVEMTKTGNVYTAEVNFGNTGIGFTISGDMPSASTIRGEQGLENNIAATGLPLTGGVLTAASVQLNLTGFTSQYSNATVSFNLLTNQVTQVANTCTKPTNLYATEITPTTAKLGWTAGGSETSWNIEYGLSGFTQGNGTVVSDLTTNSYTISGLNFGTNYQFYVQADCGGTNGTSAWVGPYSFTTLCGVISSFPYSNNFDNLTAFPACFSQKTSSSASVTFRTNGGSNSTACIEMNYGNSGDCYFILPQTDVLINTLQIGFYFEDGAVCTMKAGYFDASLTTFTETGSATVARGGQNVAFDFGGITGLTGTERIAIKYVAGGNWYNGRLDNLTLSQITCYKPKNLTASNITTSGATLGWTTGASETAWNIEYGVSGFTQGTGTTAAVTSNSYSVSGLNFGTNYQFYVQANCGGTDGTSSWAGPYSFTTACDAISSFPYTQDFNNVTSLPPCFSIKATTANTSWNQYGVNGTACLKLNNIQNNDCYLIFPETQPLLNTFELSFSTKVSNYIYSSYKIGYFDQTLTTFTPLASVNNSSEFQNFKVSLNSGNTLTGNERIAIKFESSTSQVDFYIDDITVTQPSCRVPFNLSANNITTSSATLGWTAGAGETAWTLEYGLKGFARGNGTTVNTTATNYQLNDLSWGTEYDFYVRANCSASDTSMWTTPFTFSTLCQDIATLPYYNNFNHLVSLPLCFDTKTTDEAYISMDFENTACIRMNNGTQDDCYLRSTPQISLNILIFYQD